MVDLHLLAASKYPDLFERTDLNNRGFADALWFRKDGLSHQAEIKRGLEANPTALIEQLQRQRPAADFTDLMIINPVVGSVFGSVTFHEIETKRGTMFIQNGETAQNYMWYRRELARFVDAGTNVWEVPTPSDAITQLVALYRNDQEPKDGIFSRLVVKKKYLPESENRDMALTLMGIRNAGIGGEIALALSENYGTLAALVNDL